MKNRILFIKSLGAILLITGLFSLFAVPAEFTSFYAFLEGGSYQYEGFGFGSLMFAFISFNVMFYFSLASFCIPAGIGNLKLKKWGYVLSLAFLKTLLILGITIAGSMLFSLNNFPGESVYQLITLLVVCSVLLIILPYYLIRFYKDKKTKQNFNSNSVYFFEQHSPDSLTIILLNFFWIFVFCLFMFFKGAFPLWGRFIFKTNGTYLLSIAIFTLLILNYLFYFKYKYVDLGILFYCIMLFFTFAITFFKNSTAEFLNLLELPVYEIENVLPAFIFPVKINLGFFFSILIFIQIFQIYLIRIEIRKKRNIGNKGVMSSHLTFKL